MDLEKAKLMDEVFGQLDENDNPIMRLSEGGNVESEQTIERSGRAVRRRSGRRLMVYCPPNWISQRDRRRQRAISDHIVRVTLLWFCNRGKTSRFFNIFVC